VTFRIALLLFAFYFRHLNFLPIKLNRDLLTINRFLPIANQLTNAI